LSWAETNLGAKAFQLPSLTVSLAGTAAEGHATKSLQNQSLDDPLSLE